MITVSMAVEDKRLWAEMHSCLQCETARIDFEQPQTSDLSPFMEAVERSKPDLTLIDVSALGDALSEVIQKLRVAVPGSMIIALNTSEIAGPVLECFRAGADEYLSPPLGDGLRKALVRRNTDRTRSENANPGGRVVTFLSAKGGCGATTLACHAAVELARLSQSVLLADLDLHAGMVAFVMKSKSQYSIVDALNNTHRLDASYWKALVSNGLPGLEIISAPTALAAKLDLKLSEIRQILGFARTQYRWTVGDAGRSIDKSTMTALESSDQACLVTTPEIPALQQTKQILQTLLDGGYKQDRIKLILNRVPKRSAMRPEELEKMLGMPFYAVFPEFYSELHEAYSQGQLLPSGSVPGQYMGRLARKLAGVEEQKAKRKLPFFG